MVSGGSDQENWWLAGSYTPPSSYRWLPCVVGLDELVRPLNNKELELRDHRLEQVSGWSFEHFFGGAQAIYKLKNGYLGASDHRREGHAVGF